jgi:hypothetical protein
MSLLKTEIIKSEIRVLSIDRGSGPTFHWSLDLWWNLTYNPSFTGRGNDARYMLAIGSVNGAFHTEVTSRLINPVPTSPSFRVLSVREEGSRRVINYWGLLQWPIAQIVPANVRPDCLAYVTKQVRARFKDSSFRSAYGLQPHRS